MENKRARQMCILPDEPELFHCKKQAVEETDQSRIKFSDAIPCENSTGFQQVPFSPNQFMDPLFLGPDDSNVREEVTSEQFENDCSIDLSFCFNMDDEESGVSYEEIGNFLVDPCNDHVNRLHTSVDQLHNMESGKDHVNRLHTSVDQLHNMESGKDHVNRLHTSVDQLHNMESGNDHVNRLHTSVDQSHNMESGNTIEQPSGDIGENVTLDHCIGLSDANIRSVDSNFQEGTDKNAYSKAKSNTLSLADYQKSIIALLESPLSSYSLLYERSSVLTSKTLTKSVSKSRAHKVKLDLASTNKMETKDSLKEVPNGYPTNVRSLTVTGMLDGVAVRYMSSSGQEVLHGIIKGSGYLCGCQSCNYSKVVTASEFERHAGCKTSHPNNHIYLENGKAMHHIVQDLKNTPFSMLSEIDLPKGNSIICTPQEKNNTPLKLDSLSKCDSEIKAASKCESEIKAVTTEEPKAMRKAQNSFPSNVKCLLVTGMFDGMPVQYIHSTREGALSGIIKGSGYLCGCESCNYSKVVNAHEFQRHAGCNTHHPNNHIFFVNGKSIAQVVQDLKSTPITMLFDAIHTIAGFPINEKAFDAWKESFLAANHELQRVYRNEGPKFIE